MHPHPAPPAQIIQALVGPLMGSAIAQDVLIEIGAMPVLVRTASPEFLQILQERYGGFVNSAAQPVFEFEVEIVPPSSIPTAIGDDEDLKGAALLFASDAGKHITGQILAVDGGVPSASSAWNTSAVESGSVEPGAFAEFGS